MKKAKADGSYIRVIAKIERQDLLILDDFILQPLVGCSRSVLIELAGESLRSAKKTLLLN